MLQSREGLSAPGWVLEQIIWGWGRQKQAYRSRCIVTGVSLVNFNEAMRSCLRQGVGSPLGAWQLGDFPFLPLNLSHAGGITPGV